MTQPRRAHYRTEQIGLRLIHHIAPAVTAALQRLQAERNSTDGWPPRNANPGRGGSDTSTTESAALAGGYLDTQAEQITDTIESIEISVTHLATLVIGIDRTPAAGEHKRCSDGQQGRDAVLWSNNTDCAELPTRLDMCGRHYMAYYRYRVAHHLSVDHYFEAGADL